MAATHAASQTPKAELHAARAGTAAICEPIGQKENQGRNKIYRSFNCYLSRMYAHQVWFQM